MSFFDIIWNWIDSRAHISDIPLKAMPEYTMDISYWTGGLLAAAFIFQAITGVLLMLYYTPGASTAYSSTQYIINKVPFGIILLNAHLYMAYVMILLIFIHFFRNYYIGAYKKPRELAWIIGILMALVVVGSGFTGYFLPYTEVSVDATDVGVGLASKFPLIGNFLASLITGNGTISSEFGRMLDLHILILPAILMLLFGIHMYLYEKNEATPPVSMKTEQKGSTLSWVPTFLSYTAGITLILWGFVIVIASVFPVPLAPEAGSSVIVQAMPEWYLVAPYKVIDFVPISSNIIYILLVIVIFYMLVPFFDRSESRDPKDRPFFVSIVTVNLDYFILFTIWGYLQPAVQVQPVVWIPIMLGIIAFNFGLTYGLYYKYRKVTPTGSERNSFTHSNTKNKKQHFSDASDCNDKKVTNDKKEGVDK